MLNIAYLVTGGAIGVLGGILGIGGGVVLIPILIYVFGMNQHQAQGTTLAAMIPPIGLLAAMRYYRAGHISVKIAALIALGFFIGGYFGGGVAQQISDPILKKSFGLFITAVGLYMYFAK